MRKAFFRIIAFLAVLASVGAIAQTPSPKKQMVIWGVQLGPDSKGQEALVHAFQDAHPEYDVKLLSMGAGQMNPQKLMTSIVGGVAPDVIFQDRFTIGDWASRGAFMPLDGYMQKDKHDPNCPKESDYYPAVWREAQYYNPFTHQLHLYGIPYGADDRILYYNKAIFQQDADKLRAAGCDPNRPPHTCSEVLKYGKALTEFNPDGSIKRAGFLPNFGNSWLYLYSFQMNGSFMNADGTKCTMATPQNEAALQFMVDGYDQVGGYEKCQAFQSGFLQNENDPFLVGKVAMKIDGDWILQDIVRYAPTLDLGVAPAPVPDDRYYHRGAFKNEKETYITWTGGFCYAIPTGAKNPDAAWQFIKFALNTDGRMIEHKANREWAHHLGRSYIPRMAASIPANARILQEYKPPDPKFATALELHMDMLKHSRIRPPTFLAQELWDEQVNAIDRACLHAMSPHEALMTGQVLVQRDLDAFLNLNKHPVINLWIPAEIITALCFIGLIFAIVVVRRRGLKSLARREARWAYLLVSPWTIGFLVLTFGPMLASLLFSFTEWNVLTPAHWVGGQNFAELATTSGPRTWKAFSNVLYLAAVGVPITVFTGLSVALLLNAAVRGIRVYRTLFYMPAIVPTVASAVLWVWLLYADPNRGLIDGIWESTITHWLGLAPPGWLASEPWAKPAFILMGAWGAGSGMILWLAGLKGIPSTLYEASSIDGATPIKQFWAVTVPQLSPILFFNVVMGFIGALQEFDRVYIMRPDTSGAAAGPNDTLLVPVFQLFQEGFGYFKMGLASALAWAIFALILVLTLIQFKLAKSWVHYEAEE